MEGLMAQQLALDITDDEADAQPPTEFELAVSVLKAHDGDALAAIRNLLLDADFLRDQLFIASS